jgi:aspartyl-tRNA(Asn)/glutamyl-tRNA(Gln) amidotransferase subunit A
MNRRAFLGAAAGSAFSLDPPAPDDLTALTVREAVLLLQRRRVSALELIQACLRRIERLNPVLNAFITVTAEPALDQARALDAELRPGHPRGPLHGVPVALKDLIDTAGVRTTAASALLAGRVPDEDAEVVRRLKAAGAVLLGKLNMDEFAYNFTSETSHFGPVKNPWKLERMPGGSSGGSAAAVAARLCFAAIGSDTGGSIRLPAALCGIVGLKPTYGLVSTRGVLPLAWSMDHVGPMCRTAADAAVMLEAIAGYDAQDPSSIEAPRFDHGAALAQSVRGFRLGVARAGFFDRIDPEIGAIVDRAIGEIGKLVRAVRDIDLPDIPPMPVIRAEALACHQPRLAESASRYHPHTLHEIREGEKVSLVAYAVALRHLHRLRREIARVFAQVDVIATPACPLPPFPLGSVRTPDLIYLRNSMPFNVYGIPAASIPCGFTRDGLPVGLQLAGPRLGEGRLLALAHAYQQVTAWHTRVPPFGA